MFSAAADDPAAEATEAADANPTAEGTEAAGGGGNGIFVSICIYAVQVDE